MSDLEQSGTRLSLARDQGEVRSIPEQWNVRSLEELASLERGKFSARPRNDPRFFGGLYPFIQTGDVSNSNGVVTSFSQTLNENGLRVSRLFPAHTMFFTIAANIADVAIAPFATACPDSLVAISPNRQTAQRWLFYALAHRKKIFEGLATQNAQLNINLEKLRPYRLPVPPLPEQRAIAAALSDVDALIGALDRLIAKKRDLKQAAMQQLLTGQTRLPEADGPRNLKTSDFGPIPEDWTVLTFGELFDITAGGDVDPRRSATHQNPTHPFPIYSNAVTSKGLYGYCSYADHPSGSITITARGTLGFALFRDHPYTAIGRVLVLRPALEADGRFFADMINHSVSFAIESTGVPQLTAPQISAYRLPVPPLAVQRAIATVLAEMQTEITALEQRRDKTRLLKHGMMQELLTGRIRLV